MNEQSKNYFFACNIMWWVLHVFYRPLEDIKTGNIPERVDEFESNFEDIAMWCSDEGLKAGKSFKLNGKAVSIFDLNASLEKRAMYWVESIEKFCRNISLDIPNQHYYLYYIECAWVLKLLIICDNSLLNSRVPELHQSYLEIRNTFLEKCKWLKAELSQISANCLPKSEHLEINKKIEVLNDYLAKDWQNCVLQYARKH